MASQPNLGVVAWNQEIKKIRYLKGFVHVDFTNFRKGNKMEVNRWCNNVMWIKKVALVDMHLLSEEDNKMGQESVMYSRAGQRDDIPTLVFVCVCVFVCGLVGGCGSAQAYLE